MASPLWLAFCAVSACSAAKIPQNVLNVEPTSLAAIVSGHSNVSSFMGAKSDTQLKVLKYQNARCTLGPQAKLLWYPHKTWWHVFFPGSVLRDRNTYSPPHDFIQGRLNAVPCQVSDATVSSLVAPITAAGINGAAEAKPPPITWLAATYEAGPFSFWAYDKAGNSMCRFCFMKESWTVNKQACETMVKRFAGKGEFDCSYEVDNHLAEASTAYVGHDIPEYWSGSYVWTRALGILGMVFLCYGCVISQQFRG